MRETPRPSFWVDVLDAATHRRHIASVLVTLAMACAGCPAGPTPASDAATRADAPIVEAGLAFDDASGLLDASSGGGDALTVRDGGMPFCVGSCDPVRARGCGTGETCGLRDEEASCGTPGRALRGAACATREDCAAGLACFPTETGEGVCDRVCCPGASDCAMTEVCGGDGVLFDGTRTSWGRCLAPRSCTLLDAAACPEREACYVIGPLGESECLLAGTALEGDRCELPNDCSTDLVCAGATERICLRLCALGGMDDTCGSGAMCVRQAYTPDGVGVCVTAAVRMP